MEPTVKTDKYELWLGDCLEILPHLSGIDAVITDPPYGLGKRMQGGTWGASRKKEMIWDAHAHADFVIPLLNMAPIVVIWGGNYYQLPPTRGWLSWFKPDAPPTMANFELAWTNQDRNARQLSQTIAATNAERVGHPTQKPLRLIEWCIDQVTVRSNSTVLDPFMGSGTTGVACIKHGRKFIGIEREEKYFDICVKRLEETAAQGILTPVEQSAAPDPLPPSLFAVESQ